MDQTAPASLAVETVAEAFLALLAARGVDYLFANSGTDFPSIIEGLAKSAAGGPKMPKPITSPHENAAVCMAYGYAAVTGKPQAVMCHVNVGTANALCGLLNAERERIPILFAPGRSPLYESGAKGARSFTIHWAQEMFDQAGMVREAVKWDYELRDGRQVESVVDRALALSLSEPRGPVYLGLPREVLAQPLANFTFSPESRLQPLAPALPDPAAIAEAARLLAKAEKPMIIATSAGRDPNNVPALAALAERCALPVVEFKPRFLNLPSDHPMHAGFEVSPDIAEADVLLVLDSDVPWVPTLDKVNPDVRVIQVGPDPLFQRYPTRGFPADVAIAAAIGPTLLALADALERIGPPPADRFAKLAERNLARREAAMAAMRRTIGQRPMSMSYVTHCLGEAVGQDATVINEYHFIRSASPRTKPGSWIASSPAGGLGWGFPAALGAQLALPGRTVVAALGDGSYLFSNPLVCHQIAAHYELPVLTVVFNNAEWHAVRRATKELYPSGFAMKANEIPLVGLRPNPSYAMASESCGGYGERVEDPEALPAAIQRALSVVRNEKRQALLDVACA